MTTYPALNTAREAVKGMSGIRFIIEIEHAAAGRCYLIASVPMVTLAAARDRYPEIHRLIAQHELLTAEEQATVRERYLRENTRCDRCGKQVDGNTAYRQQEYYRGSKVTAYYCEDCHHLLSQIGIGEYTELQERASARPTPELYTKSDSEGTL